MAQLIPEAGRLSGKELSAVGSDKRMLQFSRTVLLSQQGLWSRAVLILARALSLRVLLSGTHKTLLSTSSGVPVSP